MKLFLFCLVVVLVGGSIFVYNKEPVACQKLVSDLKADLPTIQADVAAIVSKPAPQGSADANASNGDDAAVNSSPTPVVIHHRASNQPSPSFTETTNYSQALGEARRTGRNLILHFDGSDWDPNSKALDQEVVSTANYSQFAQSNFITVTLDFPHDMPLDNNLKQQNLGLAKKYNVGSFPMMVVIGPDEKELGRVTGYVPGSGAQTVIDQLTPFAN